MAAIDIGLRFTVGDAAHVRGTATGRRAAATASATTAAAIPAATAAATAAQATAARCSTAPRAKAAIDGGCPLATIRSFGAASGLCTALPGTVPGPGATRLTATDAAREVIFVHPATAAAAGRNHHPMVQAGTADPNVRGTTAAATLVVA